MFLVQHHQKEKKINLFSNSLGESLPLTKIDSQHACNTNVGSIVTCTIEWHCYQCVYTFVECGQQCTYVCTHGM